MRKQPLLIVAEEEDHSYYRKLPLGEEAFVVCCPYNADEHLRRCHWDLLLFDCGRDFHRMKDFLMKIKPAFPTLPVLVVAEGGTEETAISAFRLGARDYFRKPLNLLELRASIETFLRLKRQDGEHRRFVSPTEHRLPDIGDVEEGGYIPLNIIGSIKYMEDNLAEPICLDDLAGAACISRYHFCRTFRKTMKMSPMTFLNHLRVQRAKKLLHRTGLNLSAVAMKTGFCSLNNMNKWFKFFEGVSPSRYASENKDS